MFHDVNLTGGGQPLLPILSPSIQKAGQIPCPYGSLRRASTLSILPGVESLCLETCRRIGASADRGCFLAGLDHQHSVFHTDVFGPIGVSLPLLIPPAATAQIKRPVFQIQFGTLEFIMPGDIPTGSIPFRRGEGTELDWGWCRCGGWVQESSWRKLPG